MSDKIKSELDLEIELKIKERNELAELIANEIRELAEEVIKSEEFEVDVKVYKFPYSRGVILKLEDTSSGRFVFGSEIGLRLEKEWEGDSVEKIIFEPLGGIGTFDILDTSRQESIRLQAWLLENYKTVIEMIDSKEYIKTIKALDKLFAKAKKK